MSSRLFKNVINKMCLQITYLMYKQDLALNNLQWLICPKKTTKPNFILQYVTQSQQSTTGLSSEFLYQLPYVH